MDCARRFQDLKYYRLVCYLTLRKIGNGLFLFIAVVYTQVKKS
jgi:hypothetical protein